VYKTVKKIIMGTLPKTKRKVERQTTYGFYAIFGLVTYFIWCDLSFFGELATEENRKFNSNISVTSTKTIKLRMQDHFGQYIDLPVSRWFNRVFGISEIFWVTPNVITAMHFALACVCGRLAASASISVRRLGVLLYFVRTWLDALDGVVYRAQSKTTSYLSGWGTYGYVIDGTADVLGGVFVLIGTLYRFLKNPPYKNPEAHAKLKAKSDEESGERLLSDVDSCAEENDENYGLKRYSKGAILFTGMCFAGAVFFRSAFWDRFNQGYHELLAVRRTDILPERQAEVLNYRSTWFSLWIWKISSADAFMNYTLFAIFFGKLWRWLRFNLILTIPSMFVVILFCQLHLNQMRHILGVPK